MTATDGKRPMSDFNGYAVFFFPNAIEALGEAIKPYLQESPGGPHILCRDIDVGGALAQLTLEGRTTDGREIDLELMFPTNMVRMIVSARSDPAFGFGPRTAVAPAQAKTPLVDDEEAGPAHPPAKKAAKKAATKAPARKAPSKKAVGTKATRKAAKKTR